MSLGYQGKLYILAFDHRGSFQKKWFGLGDDITQEDIDRITDSKTLIYEGLELALKQGAEPSVTGALVDEQFGGEVPRTMPELLSLPGVARKTANVVLGNAFGIVEGFTVDTHNIRLARRFGWTTNTDATKVEQDLMRIVPKKDWFDLSHLMIFHGRAICIARKPLCEECALAKLCPSAFVRPA